MNIQHGLGPELGSDPITYTCWCGFRDTDYNEIQRHIADEYARAHSPRRLTTIPTAIGSSTTSGIEIASTPYGDEETAVEVRMIVPDGSPGHYRHHMVLVHLTSIPFLIEALEAHRLDKDRDPCDACAAHAFAARLTDDASRVAHTCPATGGKARHQADVVSDYESLRRGASCRTATCLCGWRGPQRATLELATDDALMHERAGDS